MRYSGDDDHYIDFDQSRPSVERLAEHGVEEPGGTGTNFLVWSADPPYGPIVEGVLFGTLVRAQSNFDLDTLLRFTRSLMPVDRASP